MSFLAEHLVQVFISCVFVFFYGGLIAYSVHVRRTLAALQKSMTDQDHRYKLQHRELSVLRARDELQRTELNQWIEYAVERLPPQKHLDDDPAVVSWSVRVKLLDHEYRTDHGTDEKPMS